MEAFNRKSHWENIYQTKGQNEVSWYQERPVVSLDFIEKSKLPLDAKIIDIGGGDGFLVDCLLELGYSDITVLDISETALIKAKQRLGNKADLIKWIVTDITSFEPEEQYDLWHDRAVFHFLIHEEDINIYTEIVDKTIKANGILIVGTFSENGPKKCSGIEIKQYSEEGLTQQFEHRFYKENSLISNHTTPFDTIQNFTFCSFRKKNQ